LQGTDVSNAPGARPPKERDQHLSRSTLGRAASGYVAIIAAFWNWLHPCGSEAVIVAIQSGDVLEDVPLIQSADRWVRLDLVR